MENKEKEQIEKELSAIEWVSKCEAWKQEDLQALREVHWQWYIHYLFYRGEHYSKFDTSTGKVVTPKKGVTINMIKPVVRAIANSVSKLQLKTTIYTDSLDEEVYENAVEIGRYWDRVAERLELTKLYRKVIKLSCLTGAVPVRICWKDDKVDVAIENPFLTLPDTSASSPREGNRLTRIVKRSLADCKRDPEYDPSVVNQLQPETKFSDTPIFDQVVQMAEKIQKSNGTADARTGSVWVTETYVKEAVENNIKVRKICTCQNNVLYNELTELEDFPVEWFMIEEDGISLFPEAWVKDLIPLVQAINKHETQIIEYMDKLPGGIIKLQGGKIKIGKLEDGTRVYEIDGQLVNKIDQLQLPPLPSSIDNILGRFNRYIEDIGAFTEVSRGMSPSGATSGEYLKALMAGDSNNTIEIKENLANFATRVTKKALWNISKYQETLSTQIIEEKGERKEIKVVGGDTPLFEFIQKNNNNADYQDVLAITADNNLRVEIDSDIAHTLQSKKDELIELYQLKDEKGRSVLPVEVLLKAFGFGNTKDVIEQLREQRMEAEAIDTGMAKAEDEMIQRDAQAEMGMVEGPIPTEQQSQV